MSGQNGQDSEHTAGPAETLKDNAETQTKQEKGAAGNVQDEVDDFGLPIRKARRPMPAEDASDDDEYASGVEEQDKEKPDRMAKDTQNMQLGPDAQKEYINGTQSGGSKLEEGDAGKTTATASSTATEPQNKIPDAAKTSMEEPKAQDPSMGEKPVSHSRNVSASTQPTAAGTVSEWSYQQMAPHTEPEKKDDELGWQEMPSYAEYDLWDDEGKLIAKEHHESDEEEGYAQLGGAAKGYTRALQDEDAKSTTSIDVNTAYLFKEAGTNLQDEDDDIRDPLSQMQATKDLLTEGQRIAYVGLTRLCMLQMVKELEKLERTKGAKKEIDLATEAMKMWSQKMMVRLYGHMEIDSAEQIMIEQLAEHGVEPKDLTPALMQNSKVNNPMAEEANASMSQPQTPSLRGDSKTEAFSSTDDVDSPPPPYEEHAGNELSVRTPSQLPTTKSLDIDLRWTVLCDLFLVLISDAVYDARSRLLLERVGEAMDVPWLDICRFEKRVTDALEMQEQASKENWNEDEHMANRKKSARNRRLALMGLATVGGGLVIGLSAGLLAPVIGAGLAAGFTTIGVAGTGTFLAGAGGAAIITTTGVLSGGTIAVRAADRRTGAVKTFEYRPLHNNKRVNLIVTVAGWMTGKVDDVRLPYSTVDPIMGDMYSVFWEPEMLRSMGDTINILATEALTQGLQQILGSTVLVLLMASLQLPIVLTKLAYLIDNPWTVSLARADAAGLILADSLIDRNLGVRPITLVGFSLGARVIFSCLKELANKGAHGLIQNVYLFGSPMVAKKDEYLRARTVVSGRFVNGYASNDWILGYLFRATSGGIMRVAGLAPVEIPGIENLNVTELVPGHMAYRRSMPRLLRECGWAVESDEFSEIEDPDPENHEARQRELINEIEEARKEMEKKEKNKKGFRLWRKKVASKKEWETYDDKIKTGPSAGHETNGTAGADGQPPGSVLFDIEAIRREAAELAAQGIQIKELDTTLGPMKLDTAASSSSANHGRTQPPHANLKESKSFDGVSGLRAPVAASTSSLPPAPPSGAATNTTKGKWDYDEYDDYDHNYKGEENISMSFEPSPAISYRSPSPAYSPNPSPRLSATVNSSNHQLNAAASPLASSTSVNAPPPPAPTPPTTWDSSSSSNAQRPALRTSNTLPAGNLGLGMNLEHNAWADDDDEFKEKEMTMTFA